MAKPHLHPDHQDAGDDEYISRSEIKRQMEALQQLGKRITELNPQQQAQVPMDETLRRAVEETRRISSNGALRRHMQYIGKLMRKADADAIEAALNRFDATTEAHNRRFHQLERWRDRLLSDDASALAEFIEFYPRTDVQLLRQLIRNAKREQEKQLPPTNFRKLFKLLRELDEHSPSQGD